MTSTKHLLYIHGFNSSPKSLKAELTKKYFQENTNNVKFHCPQIANSPIQAINQLESILTQNNINHCQNQWFVMGSSLGGYFSTYLAEKYALKAVLINPAVKPFDLMTDYIGKQVNPYTEEEYWVKDTHIDELKMLYCDKITEKNYQVMVQTADEVLDYQQAVLKYQGSQLIVQEGGDHSFTNYESMLPKICKFLGL